ncbi:MAG: NAD(P)/FAD-dependent oxidoreductase [Rhodobacteraceae bacterium]|nr:NAD(P)/FAD-dependent oxidoreductase [Paracoccaceae bacterium]
MSDLDRPIFDIIVIGGGVVGCALMRRFALNGARALLLEKGADILSGVSKANSAILHTGFDAPPGSVEGACMQAGYKEYLEIYQRFGLPLLETGALVVAWNEEQLAQLDGIIAKAHENGVDNVSRMPRAALRAAEPQLADRALGAVLVPHEFVIDPWSSPLAYLRQAVALGAEYRFNTEVKSGEFSGKSWRLGTSNGDYSARIVINCTGTQGDIVQRICTPPAFEIRPRKGQFLVYDKSAASLIKAIILPVPTPTTKGVVLTKTIFGNLLLGPTAEEQEDRDHAQVDANMLQGLIDVGTTMLPALPQHAVTATYAGLRPATEFKDYQIKAEAGKNWIGVNGIRSTGLTAALGIATYVAQLCAETFPEAAKYSPPATLIWPVMPMLAEHEPRAYQKGDDTEIICHCERVTRGDIERALGADIPAKSLGGLRRRTRVMMGRCNGFYCAAKVAKLTEGQIYPRLAKGGKDA